MDKLILVQVGDSAEHLCYDLCCILFRDKHSAVDILINLTQQVTTLTKFSNNEEALAVLEDLLETQDIRMIEILQQKCHRHELVNSCII